VRRLSVTALVTALAVLVGPSAGLGDSSIRVPQAHHRLLLQPAALLFRYQPPGSYGDEETHGRPLYPPFRLTGLNWETWRNLGGQPGQSARGYSSAWLHYDTCDPNCLHGRYAKVRARVKLDGVNFCEKDGNLVTVFDRITVTPAGGPARTRFIQCTGRVRSGRKSDVIPAGVGFYR
jgi:hypothetical protein